MCTCIHSEGLHFSAFHLYLCFRCIYAAQKGGLPPICTHNVVEDQSDPVLCNIRRIQLFNSREDRVKVRGEGGRERGREERQKLSETEFLIICCG